MGFKTYRFKLHTITLREISLASVKSCLAMSQNSQVNYTYRVEIVMNKSILRQNEKNKEKIHTLNNFDI